MRWLDAALNGVLLMLWARLRARRGRARSAPRNSTLNRAGSANDRWKWAVFLSFLFGFRPWMFWLIDTSWDWTPYLHLGVAQLPFNGAHLGLTVCYSILSFLVWLGVFWIWISCFFSLGKGSGRDGPAEAWMRTQLGWTARLPTLLKVTLPGACLGGAWWALRPCMVRANMLPPLISPDQAWQEAVLVGCATLPHWLGAMAAALFLEGLSTYFVLGYSPLLDCAKAAANRMRPLWAWIPAQWGALELRPFVGALLLALAALGMRFGLERLFFHKVTGGG